MKKLNRVFLAMLVLVSFIASGTFSNIVSANSIDDNEYRENIRSKVRTDNANMMINNMTKDDLEHDASLLKNNRKIVNYMQSLNNKGYKEMPVDFAKYNTRLIDKNHTELYSDVFYKAYQNDDGTTILIQVITDGNNDAIEHIVAQQMDKDSTEGNTIFEEYSQTLYSSLIKKKFHFAGMAFACSAAGLFACMQFCGVWGLVNAGVGATCDLVCGTAFAAVCSFA